jgi:hypothetical protein
MKMFVALVALLALVGSAMAWDITEDLQYTLTKSAFEQGDYTTVLPQIKGTTSGAYVKEPNVVYGEVWGQVDNKLVDVELDRSNDWGNPYYTADKNNFYTTLTQGGSASMAISAKDTISKDPEISGSASAFQNLWVGGEFAKTTASFDSRAIIGFSDIPKADYNGYETSNHFVVTDVGAATASVDANKYGAGLFNTANMGVKVDADIEQNYVGSGWADPTYSGGITMWANFAGACDPGCANPILTSVNGVAGTSIFPANIVELGQNDGPNNYGIGDTTYWGTGFKTDPVLQKW